MAPVGVIMMTASFSHIFQLGDSTGAQLETNKGVYNGAAGFSLNVVMVQVLFVMV